MSARIGHYLRNNVTGLIAIFIALSGTTYAATVARNSVKSSSIKNGQVKTKDLADGAVTTPKVRNGTITSAKLAPGVAGGVGGQAPLVGHCVTGQAIRDFDSAGNPQCDNVQAATGKICSFTGSNYALTSIAGNGDTTCDPFQKPLTSSCASGTALQGFNATATTLNCVTVGFTNLVTRTSTLPTINGQKKQCNTGERAVGGGAIGDGTSPQVIGSYPIDSSGNAANDTHPATGWAADVTDDGNSAALAFVICAS